MLERPLKVLVVSDDRRLLRHLSQLLNVFGFEVRQAADTRQGHAALAANLPDLLLADGDLPEGEALELCRRVDRFKSLRYVHKLLMTRAGQRRNFSEALSAGVEDFLAKPIVHGELLSRLRAGARVIEHERRLRTDAPREPLTEQPSRSELLHRATMRLEPPHHQPGPAACAVLDLDYFGRVAREQGRQGADRVLRDVARVLADLCEPQMLLASLGGDRFAMFLADGTLAEAVEWAQGARKGVSQMQMPVELSAERLTASCGVAETQPGQGSAQRLVQQAEAALLAAKRSGRDCVVAFGEYDQEAAEWSQLAAPGKLFEHTRARDVMTPCVLVLRSDEPLGRAAWLLDGARLGAAAVVGDEGKLAGIVERSAVDATRGGRVGDVMNLSPKSFDEEAVFADLVAYCSREETAWVAITHRGRPCGLVSPEQLAALCDRLTTRSFSHAAAEPPRSQHFLVPDLGPDGG